MSKNVGTIDRVLRTVIGLSLLAYAVFVPEVSSTIAYGAGAIGLILLATAVFSFCPLYRLVGLRTCKDS